MIKWLFIAIFFLNILFITTGTLFSIHYYQNQKHTDQAYNSMVQANQTTLELIHQLEQMRNNNQVPTKLQQAEWLVGLKNHPQFQIHQHFQKAFDQFNKLPAATFLQTSADDFIQKSYGVLQENLQKMNMQQRQSDHLHTLLITSVLASIVVGIALPIFLFFLAGKTLQQGYKLTQQSIRDWSKEWKTSLQSHGDKPFQNPVFWSRIGLVTAEVAIKHHPHPALIVVHDVLHIVRQEFSTQDQNQDQCQNPADNQNHTQSNTTPIMKNMKK